MQLGDHLYTGRRLYVHHGVYVGMGQVAHFSGLADGFTPGPIYLTTVDDFADGCKVKIKKRGKNSLPRQLIVERALSRLGEEGYNVLTNNCEHFANWCCEGEARSDQVRMVAGSAVALAAGYAGRRAAVAATESATPVIVEGVKQLAARGGLKAATTSAAQLLAGGTGGAVAGGTLGAAATSGLTYGGLVAIGAATPLLPVVALGTAGAALGVGAVSLWNTLFGD